MELLKTAEELFKRGKFKEALEVYREALNQGKSHPAVYYNMGLIKEMLGDLSGAEVMYRQSAKMEPEKSGAWSKMIQMYLKHGQTERAEALTSEMLRLYPEDMDGFHRMADILLAQERAEEAFVILRDAMDRFTSNPLYIYDLCRILGRMGEGENALILLDENKDVFSNEFHLLLWKRGKALVLSNLNRNEEALPYWKAVYEGLNDRQAAMNCMMGALAKQNWQELLEYAEEITEKQARDAAYFFSLYFAGLACEHLGQEEKKNQLYYALIEELEGIEGTSLAHQLRSVKINVQIQMERWEDARQELELLTKEMTEYDISEEKQKEAKEMLESLKTRIDQRK